MTIDLTRMDRYDVKPCIEFTLDDGTSFVEEYDTKKDAQAELECPFGTYTHRLFWRVVLFPDPKYTGGDETPVAVADFETEQQAQDVACALQFVLYKYHHN